MKRTSTYMVYIAVMLLALSSCDYREMGTTRYDKSYVWIAVDWSEFTEETPTGMSVYCYPRSSSGQDTPYIYLSNDISGVMAHLPIGEYDILVINQSVDEFGSMRFEGMEQFSTAMAVLEEYATKWNIKSDGQTVAYEPEWLAVDTYENFSVTSEMVKSSVKIREELRTKTSSEQPSVSPSTKASATLTLYPENVVYTSNVRIRVYGADNLRSVRGSMTGMASSYIFSTGARGTASPVTHPLETWSCQIYAADATKGEVSTVFRALGLPDGSSRSLECNHLAISCLLVDNETYCDFGYDVGDRIIESRKTLTLSLEIGFVRDDSQSPTPDGDPDRPSILPDVTPVGGGGFVATLEDWADTKEIYVPL